ncbi:hypothetical protein SAMN05421682_115103 [Chryseobacterium indoltheticum]|uniref:Uncharacterized protein n=1 Tax=Chryseobacterium indoltheticum TaxID=254 RepID=A0A381FA84_9FLAO|nr:hypothetical protein SAMN05421682_115103 [Chryseobacterium indoltheticum]SUX43490.1 Uncharacterised protein [Chryseobacterium indoltheticum]
MKNLISIWNEKEQRFVSASIEKSKVKISFLHRLISLIK